MLYIRFMWNDDQIRLNGLWEYSSRRRNRRGRPPTFLSSGSELHDKNRFDPWLFGDTVPDNETTKRMFSIAIGILVTETVTNHVYRYDSKILKQEKEEPLA